MVYPTMQNTMSTDSAGNVNIEKKKKRTKVRSAPAYSVEKINITNTTNNTYNFCITKKVFIVLLIVTFVIACVIGIILGVVLPKAVHKGSEPAEKLSHENSEAQYLVESRVEVPQDDQRKITLEESMLGVVNKVSTDITEEGLEPTRLSSLEVTTVSQEKLQSCGILATDKVLSSEVYSEEDVSIQSIASHLMVNGRVVGGTDADIISHPWQVFLDVHGGQCGGSIIRPDWIIFAAHCVSNANNKASMWKVHAGVTKRKNFQNSGQKAYGKQLIVHKNFDQITFDNDVALLQIHPKLEYNELVQPICLPPMGWEPGTGSICDITGWGLKKQNGPLAKTLQAAKVTVLSTTVCNSPHMLDDMVSPNMICAGSYDGLVDGCLGDSGSPLACPVDGKQFLYGISSWGIGCGQAYKPGVYAKVSNYVSWINQHIDAA